MTSGKRTTAPTLRVFKLEYNGSYARVVCIACAYDAEEAIEITKSATKDKLDIGGFLKLYEVTEMNLQAIGNTPYFVDHFAYFE